MKPGTRWIVGVVALLGGNALAVAVLLSASSGDTNRRVLPNYYQRAATWDQIMADAVTSQRLGWTCDAAVRDAGLAVDCRDASGAPLTAAQVQIHAVRRGHSDHDWTSLLTAAGDGHYVAQLPHQPSGIHDLTINVERGSDRWSDDRTIEFFAGAAP